MDCVQNKIINVKDLKGFKRISLSRIHFATLALLVGVTIVSNSTLAKMYRWVDKSGKVHYSQSIPPSQAQLGHKELNEKSGMTITNVESSEIKKQRKREEQLIKDKTTQSKKALREELMVYMFASKPELIRHFDKRLEMISVNIRLLQFHQKKLVNSVEKIKERVKRTKNDKLKKELEDSLRDPQDALVDHTRAIENNETERTEVSEQLVRAIKTYDKKFGKAELNVGSLIGDSVLSEFRSKTGLPSSSFIPDLANRAEGMCSCPCAVSNAIK